MLPLLLLSLPSFSLFSLVAACVKHNIRLTGSNAFLSKLAAGFSMSILLPPLYHCEGIPLICSSKSKEHVYRLHLFPKM